MAVGAGLTDGERKNFNRRGHRGRRAGNSPLRPLRPLRLNAFFSSFRHGDRRAPLGSLAAGAWHEQAGDSDATWRFLMPGSQEWLARAAPSLNLGWRGRWPAGTVEPWRLLYAHELGGFPPGGGRVTIADAPPSHAGPVRRDAQGRPHWHAVSGAEAAALAVPAPGTTYD